MIEQHRQDDKKQAFDTLAKTLVNFIDFGGKEYAREYVFKMACRIYDAISKQNSE